MNLTGWTELTPLPTVHSHPQGPRLRFTHYKGGCDEILMNRALVAKLGKPKGLTYALLSPDETKLAILLGNGNGPFTFTQRKDGTARICNGLTKVRPWKSGTAPLVEESDGKFVFDVSSIIPTKATETLALGLSLAVKDDKPSPAKPSSKADSQEPLQVPETGNGGGKQDEPPADPDHDENTIVFTPGMKVVFPEDCVSKDGREHISMRATGLLEEMAPGYAIVKFASGRKVKAAHGTFKKL